MPVQRVIPDACRSPGLLSRPVSSCMLVCIQRRFCEAHVVFPSLPGPRATPNLKHSVYRPLARGNDTSNKRNRWIQPLAVFRCVGCGPSECPS